MGPPVPTNARAAWIVYTDASSISEIISAAVFEGAQTGFRLPMHLLHPTYLPFEIINFGLKTSFMASIAAPQ